MLAASQIGRDFSSLHGSDRRDVGEDRPHLAAREGCARHRRFRNFDRAEALAGRWPEGSEFRIVTVEEPWLIRPTNTILDVNSAEEVLASAGLKATAAVLSGNPKEVILEEAKKWNADLIVVGSHGGRSFKRFLLGSVSEAVAMKAHCSVVVVRGPARSSRKARVSG